MSHTIGARGYGVLYARETRTPHLMRISLICVLIGNSIYCKGRTIR